MADLFNKLSGEEVMLLAFIVTGGVIALTAILGGIWYNHRKVEMEASLKAELIKQNRSADEIERILKASSGETVTFQSKEERRQELVLQWNEEGKSPEEIEKLLKLL
jgi:hypothetical protein